jgi:hypothetical protein
MQGLTTLMLKTVCSWCTSVPGLTKLMLETVLIPYQSVYPNTLAATKDRQGLTGYDMLSADTEHL